MKKVFFDSWTIKQADSLRPSDMRAMEDVTFNTVGLMT